MVSHFRHHDRFYGALLFGVLVFLAMQYGGHTHRALVLAGDAFFLTYLALTALLTLRETPDDIRRRASYEDEGVALIFVLLLGVISLSLAAIFLLLGTKGPRDPLRFILTVASIPLGWLTLHTLLAFRYAHLYYAPVETGGDGDARGLAFPGGEEPTVSDFLYYSFVVGMTSQVSDVAVQTGSMRRLTLVHGVVSFFFNTVILALTVNIAASMGA